MAVPSNPRSAPGAAHDLAARLERVRTVLGEANFALAGADAGRLRRLRDRVGDDLAGHQARARDVDAPLLIVLGGVTGAGKSTVTNSLAGRELVETGVIRPTTTQPTLLCDADDLPWFTGPRILASLPRQVVEPGELARAPASPGTLRVIPLEQRTPGLALLDAPDVDSVATANRQLADLLLDAADVWLWFTTAGKYADEESMRYLARADRRGTALLVVLTQVRDTDRDVVLTDFGAKLARAGVRPDGLVAVPWVEGVRGRLPTPALSEVSEWLQRLADPEERRRRRLQTLDGAVAALAGELEPLMRAIEAELRAAAALLGAVDRTYDGAVRAFARSVEDGLPLRGEILGRWTAYVGSTRMLELAGRFTTDARRWVTGLLRGAGATEDRRIEREMRGEVADTVAETMIQLADLAAGDTLEAWEETGAGRRLVEQARHLGGHDPGFPERCRDALRAWQEAVVELVAQQGVKRRTRARWMSTAINAVATGAIVVALASTGGLTGAEAGIATAAGAANQALLTAALGERTVRWLVARTREDLVARFDALLRPERRRFAAVVADAAPEPELPSRLRRALAEVRA